MVVYHVTPVDCGTSNIAYGTSNQLCIWKHLMECFEKSLFPFLTKQGKSSLASIYSEARFN